jgi:DNA-binding response OmpR family regulator
MEGLMSKLRVLIVEDDCDLAEEIALPLSSCGMLATICHSAQAMDSFLSENKVDVMILDITLPDESGLSIASRLACREDMRILMLTARTHTQDRIAGFDAGGDMYMTKPVDIRELVSAVQRLGWRLPNRHDAAWRFSATRSTLTNPQNVTIKLTSVENGMVRCFANSPGGIINREQLIATIWGFYDEGINQRLLVNMSRFRSKLREANNGEEVIRTCWGVGYQFMDTLLVNS